MEKYAKLLKGLEKCAGPECCKDGCPYYNATTGGMTCRARLLLDANIAITNELARNESAETLLEHIKSLDADINDLEAANNTYRNERDKLAADNMELRKECDITVMRCQVLQNEINSLMRKIGKQEDKTDRPSVSDDALKNEYKRGYLDAMEYCFRELCKRAGGGCCHE